MKTKRSSFFLLVVILALHPFSVFAQSARGTIIGRVTDPTGANIGGARIVATNTETGVETRTATTHAGVYWIRYLPPGSYQITASSSGFNTGVWNRVELLLAQTLTADFRLQLGELNQTLSVSSEAPIIETGTMEIGTNSTLKEVHTWPIIVGDGTRQLQDFVFRSMPGTQGNTFQGSINGGQAYSHEILIDGISLGRMDLNGGISNEFTPTMDAVSEFRLHTGALSSQYGSTQTALTNFGLRSGSNEFHGTLFTFHSNSALNANTWNANRLGLRKEPRLENNFGGTLGGPIAKKRSHFFFSYEGDRFRDLTVSSNITVPLREYKEGDFSRLLDPNFTGTLLSGAVVGKDALGRDVRYGQIYDPSTTRQLANGLWVRDPFPGNIVPQQRYSEVTGRILARHDIPDPMLSTFIQNHPGTANQPERNIDNFSVKIDQTLGVKHKLAGSVVFNDRLRYLFQGPPMRGVPIPGPAALGVRSQYTPGWIVRLSEDWTLSGNKLNHLAIGYNRFRNLSTSAVYQERDWSAELGLSGVGGATFPVIGFGGSIGTLQGFLRPLGSDRGSDAPNGSTIVQNDFSWLRGAHSLRFGVEHRRYYMNSRRALTAGAWTFHNEGTALPEFPNQTGFSYASFLLGAAWSADLQLPFVTSGIRSSSTNLYFQNDYKLTSSLTLNLGVRWDIPHPVHEVANRMSSLDPTLPNPAAGGRGGALLFLGDCNGCTGRSSFAGTYYYQWAPRVGAAYSVNEKIVVRGGYGINYSPPILDGFAFPYLAGFNGSNPTRPRLGRFREDVAHYWDDNYPRFPLQLPDTNPSLLNGSDVGYYLPDSNRLPLVQNWTVGVQCALPWESKLEANYAGNKGTRLNDGYIGSLNQVDPRYLLFGDALLDNIRDHPEVPLPYPTFTGTVTQALRPFPQYQQVSTHRMNGGFSNYHSLQVTYTKRSNRGLSLLAAYTFSKSLGTADAAMGSYNNGGQDIYNRRADYSVTTFNYPQDLKVSWIYDLPFGSRGRWLKSGVAGAIAGDWSVSAVQRYQSGAPLAVIASDHDLNALFIRQMRADVVLPRDRQVIDHPDTIDVTKGTPYLNSNAFSSPPKTLQDVPVRLGNAPRLLPNLRGFATYGEDLSLIKRSPLGFRDGLRFELRVDVMNLFNRVRLSSPSLNASDPDRFGRVFSKTGVPRIVQVGLRVSF